MKKARRLNTAKAPRSSLTSQWSQGALCRWSSTKLPVRPAKQGVGLALEQMGFTAELTPEQSASFARDIGEVFASIDDMAADLVTTASAGA